MNKYAKCSEDKSRVIDMAQCGLGGSREGSCDVELMPDAETVYANHCKYGWPIVGIDSLCADFLEGLPKFQWFILKWFGAKHTSMLKRLALSGNSKELFHELQEVWYRLPDSLFNVVENPLGWKDFVEMLEDYMESRK